MKIINTTTNEVIANITTNHSMTLDEAIKLCGGEIRNDVNFGNEDVIFDDGTKYFYDELDVAC